jgi:hypothetical protein
VAPASVPQAAKLVLSEATIVRHERYENMVSPAFKLSEAEHNTARPITPRKSKSPLAAIISGNV